MLREFYKSIKRLIKKIDLFGSVPFSFRYKNEEKYSTCFGRIIFLLFGICFILYFIYNLKPFFNKENFTLQYYAMNLKTTEEINLTESETAFAFGLTCQNEAVTEEARDLFDLELQFSTQIKLKGKKKNIPEKITTHKCNNTDFYNHNNESFKILNIKDLRCIDQSIFNSNQLKGIYTDQRFTYYRFIVSSKNDSEEHFNKIDNFLLENDCKLQFYYTDIILNLSNYENPITSFVNSLFLQLNPTLIQEKNVFFMNYHLYNDSQFFHIFKHKERPKNIIGFSRIEDYSLYKGLNRFSTKSEDYEKYAKLFIRVDNKIVVIKRKYQDFMEFYADNSSLLINIFQILCILFSFYVQFKANHSITKKLFFFEGIENNKFKELKNIKYFINLNKENNKRKNEENVKKEEKEKFKHKKSFSGLPLIKESNPKEIVNDKKNLIKYKYYYLYEMIAINFPSWCFAICKTKTFKAKERLIKESHKILEKKLDVFSYIRNMLLFDIINKIYLKDKYFINFMSRPIIYLNKKKEKQKKRKDEKYVENEFYQNCNKFDFDNFNQQLQKNKSMKIINHLEQHLEEVH